MNRGMRAYVMTRGTERRMDYAFLGESPPRRWWESIGKWLFLEAEELVVSRRDGETTGLLLSGIPSGRRDVIGTRIRYTVVVDDVHEAPALGAWLVRCGLEDGERERLGRALDAGFAADYVDAWLRRAEDAGSGNRGAAWREVEERLLAALGEGAAAAHETTAEDEDEDEDRRTSWVGGVQDPVARREFRARARRLLQDARPGIAFTTHALGSVSGARRAAQALPDDVAVLLHDSELRETQNLSETPGMKPATGAVSAGKAPAPAAHRGRRGRRRTTLAIAAVTLGLAAVLGIWWLTGGG